MQLHLRQQRIRGKLLARDIHVHEVAKVLIRSQAGHLVQTYQFRLGRTTLNIRQSGVKLLDQFRGDEFFRISGRYRHDHHDRAPLLIPILQHPLKCQLFGAVKCVGAVEFHLHGHEFADDLGMRPVAQFLLRVFVIGPLPFRI